jgi:pantoate--beta-alanine ligase
LYARARVPIVVVSIFVNPRQFGPNEDFGAYPRQLAADAALLEAEGVDVLWAPTPEAIYPAGFATTVSVAGLDEPLCGANRPGHFDGVATVVCKLFNPAPMSRCSAKRTGSNWRSSAPWPAISTAPHVDAIIGVPTVREADGLAMSSRNRYLTARNAPPRPCPRIQAAIATCAPGPMPSRARRLARRAAAAAASRRGADLRDAETLEALDGSAAARPACWWPPRWARRA